MKIYTRDLVVDEDSRVIKSGDFGRHSVTRLSLADAVSRPQILSDAMSRTASVSIPRELGKEMVLAPNVIVDVHVNTHAVAPAIGAWKPNASIPVSPLVGVTLSREDDVTPLHIANLRKGNFSITIPLDVASALGSRKSMEPSFWGSRAMSSGSVKSGDRSSASFGMAQSASIVGTVAGLSARGSSLQRVRAITLACSSLPKAPSYRHPRLRRHRRPLPILSSAQGA
jgi:hypothetical protein